MSKMTPDPQIAPVEHQQIATVTSRAYAVWKETRHTGLEKNIIAEGEHFTFTLYNQPVGTSTYFDIQLVNAADSSHNITGRIGDDLDTAALENSLLMNEKCMERVICKIPKDRMTGHFAHFANFAFPCWSALQRFPEHMRYIATIVEPGEKNWIGGLVTEFKKAGIQIVPLEPNNSLEGNGHECDWGLTFEVKNAWPKLPNLKYNAEGALELNDKDYKWEKNPSFYFSKPSDMAALQFTVLGSNYTSGVSRQPKINVLILNRKGTRHLSNGEAIASGIKHSSLGDVIEVNYVENMEGSLHHQALTMHSADIIISPHGAQLTNLAFIRPCTVVIEIFPRGYYLQFFQSYVVAAGGLHFEGYEDGWSPYFDTLGVSEGVKQRTARKSVEIPVTEASIVHALPEFIVRFNACRTNGA